jgi:hypothetical protein
LCSKLRRRRLSTNPTSTGQKVLIKRVLGDDITLGKRFRA